MNIKNEKYDYEVFNLPGGNVLLSCLAMFTTQHDDDARLIYDPVPIQMIPAKAEPDDNFVLTPFAINVNNISVINQACHSDYTSIWIKVPEDSISIRVPFAHMLDIKLGGKLGIVK